MKINAIVDRDLDVLYLYLADSAIPARWDDTADGLIAMRPAFEEKPCGLTIVGFKLGTHGSLKTLSEKVGRHLRVNASDVESGLKIVLCGWKKQIRFTVRASANDDSTFPFSASCYNAVKLFFGRWA